MLPRRPLPSHLPLVVSPSAEEPAPPVVTQTSPTGPDLQPTSREWTRAANALSLLAGAPGTDMRRAFEVGAGALGGGAVAGAVGAAATFWGGLPLFATNPALGAHVPAITLGAFLVTGLPGVALGAAWTLDRPALTGSRQAAAVMGAAIGLMAGWGYAQIMSSAMLGLLGASPGSAAASTAAGVAELMGAVGGLTAAWSAGLAAWSWSDVCPPGAAEAEISPLPV